jgi:hypothetical protein
MAMANGSAEATTLRPVAVWLYKVHMGHAQRDFYAN